MPGKAKEDSSKKSQGNARKAEAAAQKAAAESSRKDADEAADWDKGAKNSSKKEAEAAKKADAARKKAERDSALAEEERSTAGRSQPKNSKTAVKKTRGLDLSQLDGDDDKRQLPEISASGLDNALDALELDSKDKGKVEKHPEKRFKAAYAQFEERRLSEMDADGSGQGLRLNQRKERIRKEFEKSPDNPFNQDSVGYNATGEDVNAVRAQKNAAITGRLGTK